jgi:hypothetical protein
MVELRRHVKPSPAGWRVQPGGVTTAIPVTFCGRARPKRLGDSSQIARGVCRLLRRSGGSRAFWGRRAGVAGAPAKMREMPKCRKCRDLALPPRTQLPELAGRATLVFRPRPGVHRGARGRVRPSLVWPLPARRNRVAAGQGPSIPQGPLPWGTCGLGRPEAKRIGAHQAHRRAPDGESGHLSHAGPGTATPAQHSGPASAWGGVLGRVSLPEACGVIARAQDWADDRLPILLSSPANSRRMLV